MVVWGAGGCDSSSYPISLTGTATEGPLLSFSSHIAALPPGGMRFAMAGAVVSLPFP
jgi:hypothetical protein